MKIIIMNDLFNYYYYSLVVKLKYNSKSNSQSLGLTVSHQV